MNIADTFLKKNRMLHFMRFVPSWKRLHHKKHPNQMVEMEDTFKGYRCRIYMDIPEFRSLFKAENEKIITMVMKAVPVGHHFNVSFVSICV